MKQNLMCIYYHDRDISYEIDDQMEIYMNRIFYHFMTITDPSNLTNYLSQLLLNLKVVFVVHSKLANSLCNMMKTQPQHYRTYELQLNYDSALLSDACSEWCIVSNVDQLFSTIVNDIEHYNENVQNNIEKHIPLSFFNSSLKKQPFKWLDIESSGFIFFRLLAEVLLRVDNNSSDMTDMECFFQHQYTQKNTQIQSINTFMKHYDSTNVIGYYTKHSSVFQAINQAFHNCDIKLLFSFRQLLIDLHAQLTHLAHEEKYFTHMRSIHVYRGTQMYITELQKFRDNIGNLICANNFLSASLDRNIALMFYDISTDQNNDVFTIIEITIDNPEMVSTPFANIAWYSQYSDEAEILFSMGTVFRIKRVENLNTFWTINLQVSNDSDNELSEILKYYKSDSIYLTLGNILRECGNYSNAEFCYHRALQDNDHSDETLSLLYYNIALLASKQERYVTALQYFEQAETFVKAPDTMSNKESTVLIHSKADNSLPSRLTILNNMGLMYEKQNNYEQARNVYMKALNEDGTDVERAIVHNNLGLLEFRSDNYDQAHTHLTQAIKLTKDREFKNFQQNLDMIQRRITSTNAIQ